MELPGWRPETCAGHLVQPGYHLGRVIEENRRHYLIATETGMLDAEIAGRMLYTSNSLSELPKVGDWVEWAPADFGKKGIISRIFPRTSKLSRKVVGKRSDEQILVANIDQVLVVQSADDTFNLRRVERFLVAAREATESVAVVLSKIDMAAHRAAIRAALASACPGVPIFETSIVDQTGITDVGLWIRPRHTAVVLGPSGAGKSSLINQLIGENRLLTREVSTQHQKGVHTTTKRHLIRLPNGGIMIDTPGIRELQLWDADTGLTAAFDDIESLAPSCHFSDCLHQKEIKCAVHAAIQRGEISPDRLDSYHKLKAEKNDLKPIRSRTSDSRKKRHLTQAKKGYNKKNAPPK